MISWKNRKYCGRKVQPVLLYHQHPLLKLQANIIQQEALLSEQQQYIILEHVWHALAKDLYFSSIRSSTDFIELHQNSNVTESIVWPLLFFFFLMSLQIITFWMLSFYIYCVWHQLGKLQRQAEIPEVLKWQSGRFTFLHWPKHQHMPSAIFQHYFNIPYIFQLV